MLSTMKRRLSSGLALVLGACATVPAPISEPPFAATIAAQGEVRRLTAKNKRTDKAWHQMKEQWAALPVQERKKTALYLRDRFQTPAKLWVQVEEELSEGDQSLFEAQLVCAHPQPFLEQLAVGTAYDAEIKPAILAQLEQSGGVCHGR